MNSKIERELVKSEMDNMFTHRKEHKVIRCHPEPDFVSSIAYFNLIAFFKFFWETVFMKFCDKRRAHFSEEK